MEENNTFMNEPIEEASGEPETAGGSGANINETKAEKFTRLATARVTKTLHDIEGIGKLSGSGYEYTPEQVEKMFGAMQAKLDEARAKFTKTKKSEPEAFTF